MQSFVDLVGEIKKDTDVVDIWKTSYDLNYLFAHPDFTEQLVIEKMDLKNVR